MINSIKQEVNSKCNSSIRIVQMQPDSQDAIELMEELSKSLEFITGDSGKCSFNSDDVCVPRSLFVVAYGENGEAIGCGAIRPVNEDIAEVKRMFASTKGIGLGSEILCYLERQAKGFGYKTLQLETRLINKKAVEFYERKGYHRIPNYGKYVGRPEAVCFEKSII